MAQYNQYYLSISANFHEAFAWASEQRQNESLFLNASCVIQSDRVFKANAPHEWDDAYDFARTAASTMRLGLLKGTNLFRIYNPDFTAKQQNSGALIVNADPAGSQEMMNDGNLLAENEEDTRLFTSHFDALYGYHRILYRALRGAAGQQQKHVKGRMIVINTHSNVVWHIKSALYFEMDGRRVTMARPYIAVKRYDLAQGIKAFAATPDDDDDDKNLDYDEMVEEMEKIEL